MLKVATSTWLVLHLIFSCRWEATDGFSSLSPYFLSRISASNINCKLHPCRTTSIFRTATRGINRNNLSSDRCGNGDDDDNTMIQMKALPKFVNHIAMNNHSKNSPILFQRNHFLTKMLTSSIVSILGIVPFSAWTSNAASEELPLSNTNPVLLSGYVTMPPSLSKDNDQSNPNAALYVTARPNRPDNVPAAILNGTRGKPPPVLAARYPNPAFPFEIKLTEADLTEEGAARTTSENRRLWWDGEELIVSARWDSDGIAGTRDPTDLVGRGMASNNNKNSPRVVEVKLQDRGITGKLLTGKSKKL